MLFLLFISSMYTALGLWTERMPILVIPQMMAGLYNGYLMTGLQHYYGMPL